MFDNSAERDPVTGKIPPPVEVLHWEGGKIAARAAIVPDWARPIVARAEALQ